MESELQTIETNNMAKKLKLQQIREQLAAKVEIKQKALKKLDKTNELVWLLRQEIKSKQIDVQLKSQELMTGLASMNTQLYQSVNTPEDFRLNKLITTGAVQLRKVGVDVQVATEEVKLTKESLPKNFVWSSNEEDVTRLKFITLKRRGICYEDSNFRIAIKQSKDSIGGFQFTVRVITKASSEQICSINFIDTDRKLKFNIPSKQFIIQPGVFGETQFTLDEQTTDLQTVAVEIQLQDMSS